MRLGRRCLAGSFEELAFGTTELIPIISTAVSQTRQLLHRPPRAGRPNPQKPRGWPRSWPRIRITLKATSSWAVSSSPAMSMRKAFAELNVPIRWIQARESYLSLGRSTRDERSGQSRRDIQARNLSKLQFRSGHTEYGKYLANSAVLRCRIEMTKP